MQELAKGKHKISLEEAKKFTAGYRKEKAEFMTADKMNEKEAKKGGMFGKEDILDLLNQPGCVGMRYYYGRNDDGSKNLVLVGVDKDNNDILPAEEKSAMAVMDSNDNGIILERGLPCPPYCTEKDGLI